MMHKFLLISTIAFMSSWSSPSYGGNVNFEDVLQVLSKMERLEIVPAGDQSIIDMPHVCWRLKSSGFEPFARVPYVLTQFDGQVDWYLVDDFPRICLFAQPKGEVERPGTVSEDFLARVQADIPPLAQFLEAELGIRGWPSKGFEQKEVGSGTMEVDDYFDPKAATHFILTRDPFRLKEQWAPTSEWDRALHYGLTMDEMGAIRADIDRAAERANDFRVLATVANPYSTIAIGAEDVAVLETECALLNKRTTVPETLGGLKKLRTIVHSAQQHQLGILITGS